MSQTPNEVSTLAYQWVVQRPDGVGFATTSHDRVQQQGSVRLEPTADMSPGELLISDDLFGSSLSLEGGLSHTAIISEELASGRLSGSLVRLLAGDWSQAVPAVLLAEGTLGSIDVQGDRIAADIDLVPSAAYRTVCSQTSPECRATLGDRRCSINMRSRRRRILVDAIEDDAIVIAPDDYAGFRMGRLRWSSGPGCGVEQLIIDVDGPRLRLLGGIDERILVGDRAIISEGCDGRRATCSERFNNILNFRGEPSLPGSEILMRFPGA